MTLVRRNHGRGHSYRADNMPGKLPGELVKLPGVTRILPAPNLKHWATRTTAEYAVNHWWRLGRLGAADRLKELLAVPDAEAGAAAQRGTDVHKLAEQLVTGAQVQVPEPLAGHVDSYLAFLDQFKPDPIALELVVCNRQVPYCGTADLVAHMRGQTWLLDIKTGSGPWPSAAVQACAYQHAETYTLADQDGAEHPLGDLGIDRCGVVHVQADGYDLRPLDTGPEVWAYFLHLAALYQADEDSKAWVGEAIDPLTVWS